MLNLSLATRTKLGRFNKKPRKQLLLFRGRTQFCLALIREANGNTPFASLYRQVFWLSRPLDCLPAPKSIRSSGSFYQKGSLFKKGGITAAGPRLFLTALPLTYITKLSVLRI